MRRLIRALVVVAVLAVAAATARAGPAVAAEGSFRFTQPEAQIPEDQAMVRIVVERLDLPVSRAVVGYRTEGRTAIGGEDFLDTTGTLVFDVGVTASSFTLFLRDDDRVEPPEQLVVHLSTNTSSILTILDDDEVATPGPPTRATVAAPPPTTVAPRVMVAPAASAAVVPVAPANPVVRRRTPAKAATPPPRRAGLRPSSVTPFELRPTAPDALAATSPPTTVDPILAVAAGLLLARVGAMAWYRARTATT